MIQRSASVVVLSLLVLVFPTAASAEPILDITTTSATGATMKGSNTVGWSFTTAVDLLVDGFGLWDDEFSDLLQAPHDVGLWTETGTLLASSTVDNSSVPLVSAGSGQWLFSPTTPFVLSAGNYVLGAFYEGSDAVLLASSADEIVTIPGVTYTGSATVQSTSLAFPITGGSSLGVFGPNISARSVPEPASILLLATGLVSAGLARRRSTRRSKT